jgi:hypothetical protein
MLTPKRMQARWHVNEHIGDGMGRLKGRKQFRDLGSNIAENVMLKSRFGEQSKVESSSVNLVLFVDHPKQKPIISITTSL